MSGSIRIAVVGDVRDFLEQSLQGFHLENLMMSNDVSMIRDTLIQKSIDAVIISSRDVQLVQNLMVSIRESKDTFLLPVFTTEDSCESIVDLKYKSPQQLEKAYEDFLSEKNSIAHSEELEERVIKNWQARLLTYLYTRKGYKNLAPELNTSCKTFFVYPLVDIFAKNGLNKLDWINELKIDGILEVSKFVRAGFYCSSCTSARMTFSERCPDCKSENVSMSDFLHCYTCGTIEPEIEFLKNDNLQCPSCHTKLRHIGEDYDKPLESYLCNDCDAQFVESEPVSSCLDCEKVVTTDQLKKVKLYEYSLSDKAGYFICMNIDYAMSVLDIAMPIKIKCKR